MGCEKKTVYLWNKMGYEWKETNVLMNDERKRGIGETKMWWVKDVKVSEKEKEMELHVRDVTEHDGWLEVKGHGFYMHGL